jgi:hypothetical protein
MNRLRRSARLLIAMALSAAITTTSLGGAAAGAADPIWTQPDHTKLTAEEVRVAEESAKDNPGDKVDAWARAHGALAVSVDDAGRYTVALPATAVDDSLAKLDASAVGVPMTVKRSTLTQSDIDATAQKLHEFAARHRDFSFGFWYDAGHDAVYVHGNLTGGLADQLRATAGKVVIDANPTGTGGRDACNRNADCNPHYGAAEISSGTLGCTSGFAMVDPYGDDYQVTAGHCFPQGYHLASGPNYYGSISDRMPFPAYDLEKINDNCCIPQIYLGRIWTDTNEVLSVSGASNANVGYPGRDGICVSGASGVFDRCGASVRNTSATFCNEAGCTYALMAYSRGSGTQMAWPGDSGGPVYFNNNSNGLAHVVGMHIASSCSGANCMHYAEKYSTIQSAFGGHIMVG